MGEQMNDFAVLLRGCADKDGIYYAIEPASDGYMLVGLKSPSIEYVHTKPIPAMERLFNLQAMSHTPFSICAKLDGEWLSVFTTHGHYLIDEHFKF